MAVHNASAFAFELLSKLSLLNKRKPCNLPPRRGGKFVGRERQITEILRRISNNYRYHITVLAGIGGVGKTALAIEAANICWRSPRDEFFYNAQPIPKFDAIIFTSSKSTKLIGTKLIHRPQKDSTLFDIFRVISETLGERSITQVPKEKQELEVKRVLARRKALLIIDNMETLDVGEREKVTAFLHDIPGQTQVIVTTREFFDQNPIVISKLTRKESLTLVKEQAAVSNISIKGNIRNKIYKRASGVPIAIKYIVGMIADGNRAILDEQFDKEVSLEQLGRFCFDSSVKPLRGTAAHKMLISMTLFESSACQDALIKIAGLNSRPVIAEKGLNRLINLSLVEKIGKRNYYNLLSITREYAYEEAKSLEQSIDYANFNAECRERWVHWYLDFSEQFGGLDWGNWRSRHNRITLEWKNIKNVLNFLASTERWLEVANLWLNIDNYADLNRHWSDRLYWWTKLSQTTSNTNLRVQALSEKAWCLMLMGEGYFQESRNCLQKAWTLRDGSSIQVQCNIANYLSNFERLQGSYRRARHWSSIEANFLEDDDLDDVMKTRFLARRYFSLADIYIAESNLEAARDALEKSMAFAREIGWERLINYAQNSMAEVLINCRELDKAKPLLKAGLSIAENMEESRRIAHFKSSLAKLYLAEAECCSRSQKDVFKEKLTRSQSYAEAAAKLFEKEKMRKEQRQIELLISQIRLQTTI